MPLPEPISPMLVADLVGDIYEAAVNARLWRQFADSIAAIYPDVRITLFSHDGAGPSTDLNIRTNFPEAAYCDYAAHYVANSPYVDFVQYNRIGLPTRSETIIDDEALFRTEHYNDYLRPHQLGHYGTGMVLERDSLGWTALTLADRRDDNLRRDHQMALLGLLAPHLRRALKLRRTLAAERSEALAPQTLFDGWTHAAFVLDRAGHVVTMNRRAEALVAGDSGVTLSRLGRPCSFDVRSSRALDAAIAACQSLSGSDAQGHDGLNGIMLPRRNGGSPYHAMLWPLTAPAAFGLPAAPGRLLLVVADPDSTPADAIGWIARRFGLSPAEARLAGAVIDGIPLADAAEQSGIRLSTARTRLKTIQAKTGCHRQLDLVRLAMSVPSIERS
ncbi:MAG: helix-turn-helix transcriptional regulator [Sphingopyxis sp.]|nr:helix-turn-helix transcriptional regulator [Sphingopyxis sp.]